MPDIGTRWETFSLAGVLVDEEVVITTKPIVVHCMVAWYNGAGRRQLDIQDNDGNSLFYIEVDIGQTNVFNARWEADNGLKLVPRINNANSLYFSILYSNTAEF